MTSDWALSAKRSSTPKRNVKYWKNIVPSVWRCSKKRLHNKLDHFKENETKAKYLLQLIENDKKLWLKQYNVTLNLLKSYKLDALTTACYISYAGIFDMETRTQIVYKWVSHLNKLEHLANTGLYYFKRIRLNLFKSSYLLFNVI